MCSTAASNEVEATAVIFITFAGAKGVRSRHHPPFSQTKIMCSTAASNEVETTAVIFITFAGAKGARSRYHPPFSQTKIMCSTAASNEGVTTAVIFMPFAEVVWSGGEAVNCFPVFAGRGSCQRGGLLRSRNDHTTLRAFSDLLRVCDHYC